MKMFLLIVTIAFYSCVKTHDPGKPILVVKTSFLGEKLGTLKYSVAKYDSIHFKIYSYVDSTTLNNTPIRRELLIDTKNSSFVKFNSSTFYYKGEKNFIVDKQNFIVKRYFFRDSNNDPGLLLLLDIDLGLIMVQELNRGSIFAFEQDSLTSNLNKLLISDTTGFIARKTSFDLFLKSIQE